MQRPSEAELIIGLSKADEALRRRLADEHLLNDGYHPELEALHNHHAAVLEAIIDRIGYPTVDRVGDTASEAAWLVVQHAIGQPPFMRKGRRLLAAAVAAGRAEPWQLAYLSDRIAVLEDRPQLYGTQFDWDEDGELSPSRHDDPALVDRRRSALGLNSLAEQTALLRERAERDNERPPRDPAAKGRAYQAWRDRVGWGK